MGDPSGRLSLLVPSLTKRPTWSSLMVTNVPMDLDLTMVESVLDAVKLVRLPRSSEDPPVDLLSVSTLLSSVLMVSTDMVLMRNRLVPWPVSTRSTTITLVVKLDAFHLFNPLYRIKL